MVATELLKLAMETEEGRKERLKKMVGNYSAEARHNNKTCSPELQNLAGFTSVIMAKQLSLASWVSK